MFSLFGRASRGEWLAPAERTVIRLAKGAAAAAIVAAVPVVAQALQGATSPSMIHWHAVVQDAAAAGAVAVLLAAQKYVSANGEAGLSGGPGVAAPRPAPPDPTAEHATVPTPAVGAVTRPANPRPGPSGDVAGVGRSAPGMLGLGSPGPQVTEVLPASVAARGGFPARDERGVRA